MIELLYYGLSALAGALVKLTDNVVDERFKINKLGGLDSFLGAAYGLLGGFLISVNSTFSTALLAITLGVLASGKIDKRAHQYGIAGLLVAIAVLGLPAPNIPLLAFLILAAALDEAASDLFSSRGGLLAKIFELRPVLDLAALLASAYLGDFSLFLIVLYFDIGYHLVELLTKSAAPSPTIEGTHLVMDLRECDREPLANEEFVQGLLHELPGLAGMQRIGEPVVHKLPASESGEQRDPGGVSGIVLIAESHISIHTFPALRQAHVDVFSCKPFDVTLIESAVKEAFDAKIVTSKTLERS